MFEFHNNKLTQVQYWINGKHYNLIDAPAEIDFDITGKLKTLRFNNKNELLSRINGPAEIYFYDGYYNEYYFINGVYYTKIKYYDLIDKVKNKKIYCGKYKKENLIIIKEIAIFTPFDITTTGGHEETKQSIMAPTIRNTVPNAQLKMFFKLIISCIKLYVS